MLEDTPELAFQRGKSGEKRGMSHWLEEGALIRARTEDEAVANRPGQLSSLLGGAQGTSGGWRCSSRSATGRASAKAAHGSSAWVLTLRRELVKLIHSL